MLANFGSASFKCDVSSLEADALQSIEQQVHQLPALFPKVKPHAGNFHHKLMLMVLDSAQYIANFTVPA